MIWSSDFKRINCQSNELKIVVPSAIISVLRTIEDEIGDFEFSIVSKIDSIDNNVIRIAPVYAIPKQIVSFASVEYCENIEGYNVVIHKHPVGLKTFSHIDIEYINCNFDLSLLYVNKTIELASFRVVDKNLMILIETKNIEIEFTKLKKIKNIHKIEKKQIVNSYLHYYKNKKGGEQWEDLTF